MENTKRFSTTFLHESKVYMLSGSEIQRDCDLQIETQLNHQNKVRFNFLYMINIETSSDGETIY